MVHTSSDEKEKAIFHAARSMQDAAQREIYLEAACGGDHELRMQVDSLLSATEDAGDFLESPPLDSHVRVDPREFGEAAGTTIGPYKLLEQIGEGGFGAVYMAEQLEPIRRRVALKIIKAGMDTKQVIARFEAERQALALMDHPNIAKVLDAGTTDTGLPYFVMELVRGVPVIEYCDERSLPTEDRLTLFCEVCLAIQHAHQKGIIHRDIKPNNVLVTTNGDQPVPKVIDFGIAKATQGRLTDKTLFTQFRQFIGTPAYMSPEQAQMSAADIDTRSDIYSLGVLLYELLTGKTPLDTKELLSSGFDEVCRRIREEEPLKPSTRLSTMSQAERVTIASKRKIEPDKLGRLIRGELDWIIMKAIEKDRGRRYETANGLAQDIKRFLSNEPVMAAAPSPLYHFQKFARRNKVALATTGVIGAVMIAAVTVSTWQAIRATNASQSERKARIEAEGAKEQALTAKNEADKQSDRAEAGEFAARENLYVAEMNVAQRAVEEGNIDRAIDILERHVPEPGVADLRGFEWRYLWRQSHRELFSIQSRGDPIYDLAFSSDGRLLASASRFGWVRIWDFSARREVFHFQVASRTHTWVAFSPDGGTIAVATLKSPDVFLWDVNRQTEVTRFSMAPARSGSEIAFSPDGSVLVAGASDGNVWFWNIASEEGVTVKRHDSGITGLSISADGARLATSSQDGAVKVWDYARRDVLHTLLRSNDEAMFVVISPNGDLVGAVPRYSPIATVWDANTGVPVTELRVWFQSHGLLFSPDGKTLALTEYAGGLTFYNTKTWEEITIYHHPGHQLNTIAFSPDGDVIVSAGDNGTIMAWPARPDPDIGLLKGHPWGIIAVMYSPDSSVIAVGTGEGSVTLWDAATEAQLYSTPASTDERGVVPHSGLETIFLRLARTEADSP